MTAGCLLISSTALLHISTDDSNHLKLKSDRKTLKLTPLEPSKGTSEIEITLSRDNEVLSHLAYPSKSVDGKYIIRIDCFYSVVFEAGTMMRYADVEV
ncbi:hypothetical protein PFISCL1PPCAC_25979, partial [Pristionchus fissidentatus]